MAAVEMRVDLSTLIDALVSGSSAQIISVARELLQTGKAPDVLLGRIGLIAAHGDSDGHATITLAAAAMLSRYLHFIPAPLNPDLSVQERALPLFAQALISTASAVREAHGTQVTYPSAYFPSELLDSGKSVNDVMHDAIYTYDPLLAERVLLGLYGTGADYRTMQVRAYEAIATTFQDNGHALIYAVRGFQVLDAVEWGEQAPNIIHWLAPHLPLRPNSDEPAWIKTVRSYTEDPGHSLVSIRTRLSEPKEANALPVRDLLLSNADTIQVCQGVYDALIKGEASPRGIGSVIALAAADIVQRVDAQDHDTFVRVSHGLLFAAAARLVFRQVQDVEVLNLLFTSAAYINALHKEFAALKTSAQPQVAATPTHIAGGGLIAASQLETLDAQLKAQDLSAALATVQRYLKLEHDGRALFGTIGLVTALTDATADQGHALQIVQAAAEEFLAWPTALANTNHDAFLQVALRAATSGKRDTIITHA